MVDNSNNADSSGSDEASLDQSQASLFVPIVESDDEQVAPDTVRRTTSSRPARTDYGTSPSFSSHAVLRLNTMLWKCD